MMIDQATVDRIIDTAQIVDVVSDFVSLKRRGANYTGLCPFHNEKTPSFSVSATKNICKCFSCGKGGNAVHFIMEHEQISFVEALKYLARKYHIEIEERELTDEEKAAQTARESMFILNSFAQEQFSRNLFDSGEGQTIGLSYFHERGFRNDIIKKFQLGYSYEQRDHFCQTALKNGYKKDIVIKTGLGMEGQNGFMQDRYRGRVMFPVHSLSGKIIAFGGRILKKNDKMAKYVNSPESEIYHKSNELYGIFFAKKSIIKQDRCFLVEGYTDVLAMHQAGIENVVASSGTSLTPGQIRMIFRFTQNVTIIYDGDAAGIKASLRGIDLILKEGLNVKIVLLPDGDDPDSFSRKQSAADFLSYIEKHQTDLIRFKTNLLLEESSNDPIKRASMITDIVRSIAIIPDHIVRSVYVKETSDLLGVSEEVLLAEINNYKHQNIEQELSQKSNAQPRAAVPEESKTINSQTESIAPAQTSTEQVRLTIFDRYEHTVIYYLVKFGECVIFEYVDEETNENVSLRVVDYIKNDLENDEIKLNNPTYSKMFEMAVDGANKDNFISSAVFINTPDVSISKIALDMIAEKYTLSKIHTKYQTIEGEKERLSELVPRALFELKDAILRYDIKLINDNIKKLSVSQDINGVFGLMNELKEKNELRTLLAKELGERIILPR